jgi:carboxypeptidase Taq
MASTSSVPSDPAAAYAELLAESRTVKLLSGAAGVLSYDRETVMPAAATETRAAQIALLSRLAHERFTSPRIGELLSAVEASDLVKDPESDAAAVVRETRRDYDNATKLPAEFVGELSEQTVIIEHHWVEARQAKNFAAFEPSLAKMISLKKREAGYLGSRTGVAYDALLDQYEPGETAANVQRVFDGFRDRLVQLVGKIVASPKKAPVELTERHFPKDKQEAFNKAAATAIGFDFSQGRLDVSVHPFCNGLGPGDTRMTTRYDEHSFNDAFFGTLHETGHCLYEQGLPKKEQFGNPLSEAVSLGIHESQSRMWENLVGRSRAFWQHLFPKAKEVFGPTLADVSLDQWYFAVNDVRPSFIRVEADEVTYNLHIMLRFELEQQLINGTLSAKDVPAAWNERLKHYLGLTPKDDSVGCLQDIHWSAGLIGYFPTYALGNLYAAQFFEAAGRELGDLHAMFAKGEFAPLLNWLRTHIHRHGRRYTAPQLVKRVTGADLSPEPLLRHLTAKANELYGV